MSELDLSKYLERADLSDEIPELKEHYKELGDKYHKINQSVRELYKYQQDCHGKFQRYLHNYNIITKEIKLLNHSLDKLSKELDDRPSTFGRIYEYKELLTIPKEELERLKEIEENYKLNLTKEN